MSTLRLGRFHVRPSSERPASRFTKMDLVRTRRGVGLERLPAAYESLVLEHGWGTIDGTIELLSPDEVIAQTTKVRGRLGAHPPPWSESARVAKTLAVARIAFGDVLVWFAEQDRYVRVPVEAAHHPADLGSDLSAALETVLHLAGSPESIELAAPGR